MRTMLRVILIGLLSLPLIVQAGNEAPGDVDFYATGPRTGCPPLTVTFQPDVWEDMSDPYITREWDFGDGSTSTDYSPTHTYTTEGSFHVRLIMTKVSGAADTMIKYNYIQTQSSFNIYLGADTTICSGASIILNASTPGATYLWNDGSTTSSIETFFEGEYYVEVTKDGCTDKDTIYVTVGSLLAADFSWSSVAGCSPIPAEFTDLSQSCSGSITEWSWDFGDGNFSTERNPVHNYSAPGDYTAVLTVKNSMGSMTSQSYTITIEGQVSPTLDLGADFSLCNGSTTTLHAGNAGATYAWSTGDITESIIATPGNKYTVTVSKDGCSVTDSVIIAEVPILNAEFTVQKNTSCFPIKIKFTDVSQHCGGNIIAWAWDFGDGNFSNDQSPEHSYTTAGDFLVTLAVVRAGGQFDDTSVMVHVEPLNMTVNLGADTTICEGGNLTLDAGNSGAAYLWSTGATTQQIVATTEGEYSVTINFEGCEIKDTVIVQQKPAIDGNYTYTVGEACLPVAVNFTDKSVLDCNQTVSSWFWEFGDGTTSAEKNPVHHFNATGDYAVKLTVTASGGSVSTLSKMVTIGNTVHTLNLQDEYKICKGGSVQLDAGISDAQYNWWPASGVSNASIQNPQVSPPASGYYYVDVTKCMVTVRDSVLILLDSLGRPVIVQEGNILRSSTAASYQWYREGVAVTGATSKTIKADRRGYYTVKTYNSTGCEKESASFFFLPVSGKEKGGDVRIKCSPNPTSGIINIVLSEIPQKPAKATVYDLRGNKLLSAQVKDNVNPINAFKLAKGMYMVEVIFDGKRTIVPVVIQ
jgi:PKD repeat protein